MQLENLEELTEGVVSERFPDVRPHKVCDVLILEEKAQLSEQLEVAKNVLALHELEAFLEVDTGLHVQILVFREEPSLMTLLDDLQVCGIFKYG